MPLCSLILLSASFVMCFVQAMYHGHANAVEEEVVHGVGPHGTSRGYIRNYVALEA